MMTVRHIEKLWVAADFGRLLRDTLAGRAESSLRLEQELASPVAAAAMGLLRLDELAQSHVPLYSRLLKKILAAQESDGGWGDPLTTALCLRALLAGQGDGQAIERGLQYLNQMQKEEGIWPKLPVRRLPADAFVSAFILLQLGGNARFRQAVRFVKALSWFEQNEQSLDVETRRLWNHAAIRCRIRQMADSQGELIWS